jgi:hypothetical protein
MRLWGEAESDQEFVSFHAASYGSTFFTTVTAVP